MSRKLFEFHDICFRGKSSNRQRDIIPELQIILLKCFLYHISLFLIQKDE